MDLNLRMGTDSGKGSGEGSAETWNQQGVSGEEMRNAILKMKKFVPSGKQT